MRIPRFYQPESLCVNQSLELSPTNHRHAVQVLRLKEGEVLILFNGRGGEYLAHLEKMTRKQSVVKLESYNDISRESALSITLALALIKPDKMDYALQKAVELGVAAIQPIISERSVIRIRSAQLEKKISRWNNIIIGACEQSGRTRIPQLHSPVKLPDYLSKQPESFRLAMLPTAQQSLHDINNPQQAVTLIIGPEGGFTDQEESVLSASNTLAISFGPRILRAETAALAGISTLQAAWGDL